MPTNTSSRTVCRLLGGSGRAQPRVALIQHKLPALLTTARSSVAKPSVVPLSLPLAA